MAVETFTTPGSATWTCPTGVTEVLVECWGAGAGGSDDAMGGGGGGGGAYAVVTSQAVTPGEAYTYQVGAGGGQSTGGTASYFEDTPFATITCQAAPGDPPIGGANPGAGGLAAACTGDSAYSGGSGGDASGATGGSGGGGSSAAPSGVGANGSDPSGTSGGAGGTAPAEGGNGGAGGNQSQAGSNGSSPGGGGGGSDTVASGGSGGNGQVRLTYADQDGATIVLLQPGDAVFDLLSEHGFLGV